MTPAVAIVDTNVIVSGLLTTAPNAPTALILDAMLAGGFSYLLSVELLSEYRRVLRRPRIARSHGLSDTDIDALLTGIALNGEVREAPKAGTAAPDAGDRHLWALLESDPAVMFVTGDEALLKDATRPDRVVSPRQFVALLKQSRP